MALVVFGGGIIEMRGKIAGNVFSRNRAGAIVRARVIPVNPNTPRMIAAKGAMSRVSAMWLDSASAAQRIEWGVFADNIIEQNKVGQDYHMSGFNQFVRSNSVLRNAGLAQVLDGPSLFAKPAQDDTMTVEVSESSQELSITFADGREWVDLDGAGMIVQMGIPVNPTINFFDGPWRAAGVIRGDVASAPTSPATIAVAYPVVENQKIFVRAKIIFDDGRVSDWFRVDSICGV